MILRGGGAPGLVFEIWDYIYDARSTSMTHSPVCVISAVRLNRSRYTGKECYAESGNDYFGARYYASSMGRFMSPDPSGLLAQHPENPQSWNLYAYARNNPLILIDRNGLDCVYANDAGNGVESIDHDSNSASAAARGNPWSARLNLCQWR